MSFWGQYAFDLFFNAGCSFLAGIVIVWSVIKLFRVDQGRWKLALYFLPFLKIIWDLTYRRVPPTSIIFSGIDPLSLPPHSQSLTIGAGMTDFAPFINVLFTANIPGGKQYSTSFADYLFFWLHRHLGSSIPFMLLAGAGAISLGLILRRLFLFVRFEKERRKDRKTAVSLTSVICGHRSVDIYLSSHFQGTPFTGGIFHPYICIPTSTNQILSGEEREAVIAHELGHVKQWDLLGTFFVQGLGDLFWFVPGYRKLSKKIDRLREILEDASAIHSGIRAEFLASSLLKLQEGAEFKSNLVLYSAFFREKSVLKERVTLLLEKNKLVQPRLGWRRTGVKFFVTALTLGAVILSTFGGNHEVSVTAIDTWSWLNILPPSISKLLKERGFH